MTHWIDSAFIARAKQLGCSLDEVADLLAIWDEEQCAPVQARFHELVTDKIRATQTQIAELLAFSSQLQAAAGRLAAAPIDEPCSAGCACLSPEDDRPVPVEFGTTTSGPVPIACTLQPGQMPDRIADWQRLLDAATDRSRTADGRIRVEFTAGVDIAELVRLVQAEQQCCAFFAFVITIDERGTALEVGAPAAAHDIVAAMFGIGLMSARQIIGLATAACVACCIGPIIGVLGAVAAAGIFSTIWTGLFGVAIAVGASRPRSSSDVGATGASLPEATSHRIHQSDVSADATPQEAPWSRR